MSRASAIPRSRLLQQRAVLLNLAVASKRSRAGRLGSDRGSALGAHRHPSSRAWCGKRVGQGAVLRVHASHARSGITKFAAFQPSPNAGKTDAQRTAQDETGPDRFSLQGRVNGRWHQFEFNICRGLSGSWSDFESVTAHG